MQQAVHEVRNFNNGLGSPIECHSIRVRQSRGTHMPNPHYHEHIEFLYATGECDISVWVAGEQVAFRTGDFMVINSNVAHTFFNKAPINTYICIKALPEMIYSVDNSFFDMKYVLPFVGNSLVNYQLFDSFDVLHTEIPQAFEEAIREWGEKNYAYELSLKSQLLKIFLWTVRYNHRRGDQTEQLSGENYLETARLIRKSVEYINVNFADIGETDAAASINMSYSHYSRQFKRIMGKSFREYLAVTRINAAERLLLSTNMPITEVALACGFATSSHFIDKFKKMKGTTPSRYRQIWVKNKNEDLNNLS